MKARIVNELRELARAPMLTSRGFAARAVILTVAFVICELAGWREHTTFISGTATAANGDVSASATLGLIYMVAYFGFVLAVPILALASLILAGFKRFRKRSGHV